MEDHLVSFAKKIVSHLFYTKLIFWQFCILDIAVANEMGGEPSALLLSWFFFHCSLMYLVFRFRFPQTFFLKKTFFLDF